MRVRLVISYDGSGFHGFAVQPGQRTVGGTLTASLERYLRHTVDLTCGGRTDAGVHARGQVVSFDARSNVDPVRLQHILNKALRPAVAIRDASIVEATFDARRSATGRRYRYTVLNRPVPDPFLAGSSWHLAPPLDISAMRLACDPLHGEHDFSSFCRKPPSPGASLVRRVRSAIWYEQGDGSSDLRGRGLLVLSSDGPLSGGHTGRRRPRPQEGRGHDRDHRGAPEVRRRPACPASGAVPVGDLVPLKRTG